MIGPKGKDGEDGTPGDTGEQGNKGKQGSEWVSEWVSYYCLMPTQQFFSAISWRKQVNYQ